MKSVMSFIKRYLVDLLVVVTVLPVALIELLPGAWFSALDLDLEDLIAIVLLAISGIAISQIRLNPDRLHEKMSETNALVSNFRFFQDARIVSVQPSVTPEIWDGFISDYYAINAPWLVEQASSVDYGELVHTHARRYLNPEFGTAYYVFFRRGPAGSYFPQAVSRFRKFASLLLAQEPSAAEKVKVLIVEKEAPALTLFLGKKRLVGEGRSEIRDVAIYYVNQPPLVRENGFPARAFVSIDPSVNTILEQFSRELVEDRIEDFQSLPTFLQESSEVE